MHARRRCRIKVARRLSEVRRRGHAEADGLSVQEIAGRLRLSALATQSVMQRARAAFREAFTAVAGSSLAAVLHPDGTLEPKT